MLTFGYGRELLRGFVDYELKDLVVGMKATLISTVWQACWSRVEYIGRTGVAAWGIAAIYIALWALLGKSLNCPVSRLPGAHPEQVPIYGSGGWFTYSMDRLLAEVTSYVHQGVKSSQLTFPPSWTSVA
jgi:L-alanine-DL-glutamate epimerase-like enolase superfamily enzyme